MRIDTTGKQILDVPAYCGWCCAPTDTGGLCSARCCPPPRSVAIVDPKRGTDDRAAGIARLIPPILILAAFFFAPALAAAADRLTMGVLASSAADLATTQWGMAKGAPGVHDVNPIINGPTSATLVKVGATAGVLLLDRELKRRGHKRASKVLKITTIVVWGSAAAWNARQALRGPEMKP